MRAKLVTEIALGARGAGRGATCVRKMPLRTGLAGFLARCRREHTDRAILTVLRARLRHELAGSAVLAGAAVGVVLSLGTLRAAQLPGAVLKGPRGAFEAARGARIGLVLVRLALGARAS